jgi:hypothetical protein
MTVMYGEQTKIWKELAMIYFKVLPNNHLKRLKKTEKLQTIQRVTGNAGI